MFFSDEKFFFQIGTTPLEMFPVIYYFWLLFRWRSRICSNVVPCIIRLSSRHTHRTWCKTHQSSSCSIHHSCSFYVVYQNHSSLRNFFSPHLITIRPCKTVNDDWNGQADDESTHYCTATSNKLSEWCTWIFSIIPNGC